MLQKTSDKIWRPAGILAALKKLKVKDHIKALSDNELLFKHLKLVPIGDDKFIEVEELDLEPDSLLLLSNSISEISASLTLEKFSELSEYLSFSPIIGHDYGLFIVHAIIPE